MIVLHQILFVPIVLIVFSWNMSAVEGEIPKSVEEARALSKKIIEVVNRPAKIDSRFRVGLATPLLRFFDSENPAIRAIAIEVFPEIYGLPVEECIPYLEPNRPIANRVSLLSLCIGQLNWESPYIDRNVVNTIKNITKEILHADVVPPNFNDVVSILASSHSVWSPAQKMGMPITEFVAEADRLLVMRRFLSVLSKAETLYPKRGKYDLPDYLSMLRRRILEMVIALGEKNTGAAVEDWYRVEPDAVARSVVVDESLSWSKSPEWAARRKAILELASKDWDESIVAKAKALLVK